MSKLETNTIDNISGSSTLTIGDSNASTISIPKNITLGASGTTITVPSGATITNNGTQTGFGGDLTPSFQARLPSTQSFVGDTDTKINFSTEVWDTDSAYDTSNKRFTVPSGEAGKYYIFLTINHTYGSSRKITLKLYKNGSKFHQSDRQTDSRGFTWVNYIDLSVGDYIEIYYYLHENYLFLITNSESTLKG